MIKNCTILPRKGDKPLLSNEHCNLDGYVILPKEDYDNLKKAVKPAFEDGWDDGFLAYEEDMTGIEYEKTKEIDYKGWSGE